MKILLRTKLLLTHHGAPLPLIWGEVISLIPYTKEANINKIENIDVLTNEKTKGGGGGGGGGLDDQEDDGSDADGVAEWNLRKCAAAALDNLSMTFGHDGVLPALLPALEVTEESDPQPNLA